MWGGGGESWYPWKSQPEFLHGLGDSRVGRLQKTPGLAPSWTHRLALHPDPPGKIPGPQPAVTTPPLQAPEVPLLARPCFPALGWPALPSLWGGASSFLGCSGGEGELLMPLGAGLPPPCCLSACCLAVAPCTGLEAGGPDSFLRPAAPPAPPPCGCIAASFNPLGFLNLCVGHRGLPSWLHVASHPSRPSHLFQEHGSSRLILSLSETRLQECWVHSYFQPKPPGFSSPRGLGCH